MKYLNRSEYGKINLNLKEKLIVETIFGKSCHLFENFYSEIEYTMKRDITTLVSECLFLRFPSIQTLMSVSSYIDILQ